MHNIDEQKQKLRIIAKQQRAHAYAQNPNAGEAICNHLVTSNIIAKGSKISVYWPLGDELDPMPILNAFHTLGHPMALPVMLGIGKPLIFRSWKPQDTLNEADFGTKEPQDKALEIEPDVILAPLLAFDRSGYRLGYGGGFYDRTLEKLRKTKSIKVYGLAYAAQEMERVIRGPFDQPLDGVFTELGRFNPNLKAVL